MSRIALVLACVAGAILGVPAGLVRGAALSLQLGPSQGGYDNPIPTPLETPLPLDLVFHETGPAQNEGLFVYDIRLELVSPAGSGPLGVTFVTGPSAVQIVDPAAIARRNASGAPAEPSIMILQSTPEVLWFDVVSAGELSDINEGDIAARVFYTYHLGGRPNDYLIVVDEDEDHTVFASGDPRLPIRIDVDYPDVGRIFYPPEPSCVSLLAMAGLMGLRWRTRRAPHAASDGALRPHSGHLSGVARRS